MNIAGSDLFKSRRSTADFLLHMSFCARLFLLSVFLLSLHAFADAQPSFTVSGYARDLRNGETLIGATIAVKGQSRGISSNQYGFYSISLPPGEYTLLCSYSGYQTLDTVVNLRASRQINFDLLSRSALEEVVVTSRKRDNNVKQAQMGRIVLPIDQIKAIPAFAGEVDLLKVVQLLPGVRNAGEGSAGIYVRGGGPDQNLILLDDAVVYNTGHLFGFFSIFNSDAIKNVSLIKGGMPAQYGGRLSSVLDVSMKEGNNKKIQVDGGIGLIASRLSIQGPLKKDKASFIVSARRTYVDALVKPFLKSSNSSFNGSGYYFYDLNAKVNYRFSEKDRLYISGYFGRDVFDFVNGQRSLDVRIPWGNATGTIRWNHVFNRRLFANTALVYNNYNFNFSAAQNNFVIRLESGIRDYNLRQDFDWYPATGHKVKFGINYTYHKFTPSVISGGQDSIEFRPLNPPNKFAHEAAAYLQDDWEINDKWKLGLGLRYSLFQQVGPLNVYDKDADGNVLDSTFYGRGTPIKTYGGPEPRATLRYALDDNTSIKASVTRNLQYIHLVSNAATTLPTDLWVPSTLRVQPQKSWMYAAGLFKNFDNNRFETSLEVYYKDMENQIEYKEGYTPTSIDDTENSFVFGRGWSYGTELFVNKTQGKLTGWVGYTLSWTWRRFPDLNFGNKYPAKFDRRHDLSIVAMYALNDKWRLSATFVYGSGNATTLPERFYFVNGILTQEYSRINEYRLPAYHRLDLSAVLTPRKNAGRNFKTEWVFSIYNAYSRQNPYFIYFDQSGSAAQGDLQVQARQVSLFPIIPAVTFNFRF
jgi:hypothetical protein